MIFTPLELPGAFLVVPEKIGDERGFFARAWCRREFRARGLAAEFPQANVAFSRRKGTLRGMHYQKAPAAEAKLIRCTRGRIYDVMIDLRRGSPSFTRWCGRVLSARRLEMLYVPEGVAHGYLSLADTSEVCYLVSQPYAPALERGVRWDDPAFGVDWPAPGARIVSAKDRSWPPFAPPARGPRAARKGGP